MKDKIIINVFLVFIILLGIILFNYAFPNLSVQQCVAATLSIYCFSFATGIWIKFGFKGFNN